MGAVLTWVTLRNTKAGFQGKKEEREGGGVGGKKFVYT